MSMGMGPLPTKLVEWSIASCVAQKNTNCSTCEIGAAPLFASLATQQFMLSVKFHFQSCPSLTAGQ